MENYIIMKMTVTLSEQEVKLAIKQYVERSGVHVESAVTLDIHGGSRLVGYGPCETSENYVDFRGASVQVNTEPPRPSYCDPRDHGMDNPAFVPGEQ